MKRLSVIKIFSLMLFVFSLSAFGQSNEKIEQELVSHIRNIQKWSYYKGSSNSVLLEKELDIFKTKLLKYTKLSATLKYKFNKLDEYLAIATSKDGKFRIYSWDTEGGGTMHYFQNVYQFLGSNGKVYSKSKLLEEGDPDAYVSDIFDVDTKKGKVYLVNFSGIYSGSDRSASIEVFRINGNSLDMNVKIIKTKLGLTNSLSFAYNFLSVVDRKERPIKLILYDKKTTTIKIPVVVEDKEFGNGRVTNKFINYKFNGTYFVKVN